MRHELRLHRDRAHLTESITAAIAHCIRQDAATRDRFSFVLAGGGTPQPVYERLAEEHLPWERIHLFWGDERYVPHDDPQSNYRMVREALIDRVPVPEAQVHAVPTHYNDPGTAAAAYGRTVQAFFGDEEPTFDLILLGMGDDGHTASLFPGTAALDEKEHAVTTATAPAAPRQRITLTFPVLNQARNVFFLVSGSNKAEALRCAFGQPSSISVCPAGRVKPIHGNLVWWVDADAAGEL